MTAGEYRPTALWAGGAPILGGAASGAGSVERRMLADMAPAALGIQGGGVAQITSDGSVVIVR